MSEHRHTYKRNVNKEKAICLLWYGVACRRSEELRPGSFRADRLCVVSIAAFAGFKCQFENPSAATWGVYIASDKQAWGRAGSRLVTELKESWALSPEEKELGCKFLANIKKTPVYWLKAGTQKTTTSAQNAVILSSHSRLLKQKREATKIVSRKLQEGMKFMYHHVKNMWPRISSLSCPLITPENAACDIMICWLPPQPPTLQVHF